MNVEDILGEPIEHLRYKGLTTDEQRFELELLEKMNRRHALERQGCLRYRGRK